VGKIARRVWICVAIAGVNNGLRNDIWWPCYCVNIAANCNANIFPCQKDATKMKICECGVKFDDFDGRLPMCHDCIMKKMERSIDNLREVIMWYVLQIEELRNQNGRA
jgi:hypothetical protein